MRASEYTLYKSKAAMRLKLIGPEAEYQLGCIMLNIASATGPKAYDWQNKISVKFGVNDVTNLMFAIASNTEANLFHEFQGGTKRISLKPSDKGWFMTVNQISIPVSFPELYAMKVLFEYALPKMHNW